MAKEKIASSDAFRVYEKPEKKFLDAFKYELKYEDNEREKLLTVVNHASESRELFSEATPDTGRNWSHSMADDNPLYTDESYGQMKRLGTQAIHGNMVWSCQITNDGQPDTRKIKKATKIFFAVFMFSFQDAAVTGANIYVPARWNCSKFLGKPGPLWF